MSTLDDARAWCTAAVEAHRSNELPRAASAAQIGAALAALAAAEHAAGVTSTASLPAPLPVRTISEVTAGLTPLVAPMDPQNPHLPRGRVPRA